MTLSAAVVVIAERRDDPRHPDDLGLVDVPLFAEQPSLDELPPRDLPGLVAHDRVIVPPVAR
ncbi:MAG: hypothetical protein ACT4NY_27200 [Pseudonocardiales bacterium]